MIEIEVFSVERDEIRFRISRQEIPESFAARYRIEMGKWHWCSTVELGVSISASRYPDISFCRENITLYIRGTNVGRDNEILRCSHGTFDRIRRALGELNRQLEHWSALPTLEEEFFRRIAPTIASL